jgi:spore coat protein B
MDREMMEQFVGKIIKVDRGGPESRSGKLLAVFDDYFTILTENDGVVYYKTTHVRSITESSKDDMKFGLKVPNKFDFNTAENFVKLLRKIRFQWVKINRGGPESFEGVLSDVNKHFASLIVKEEVVRVSMKHIRNISYGLKVSNESNGNDNDDKNDDKDDDNKNNSNKDNSNKNNSNKNNSNKKNDNNKKNNDK